MATSVPVVSDAKREPRARSICFTINNYDDTSISLLKSLFVTDNMKYLVFGYEVAPTTGTKHIQGYLSWENPRSITKFNKHFSGKIHTEIARGTPQQAAAYCKKDGKFEEFGELPKQGARTDWARAQSQIESGEEIINIISEQPQLIPCIRAIERVKALTLKPLHREVNVITLVGTAGSGKTRWAYEHYADIYSKPRGEWWDGYTGQKIILLDDYYGYLPYCELLRVLDRYPYQVPVKGGFVQAQWDTVIITSNKEPNYWYRDGLTPALRRRLKTNFLVTFIDGESRYEEVQDWEA